MKVASTVVVGDVLRGFVFAGVETVQHVEGMYVHYVHTCKSLIFFAKVRSNMKNFKLALAA